jgi:hypothetical protein
MGLIESTRLWFINQGQRVLLAHGTYNAAGAVAKHATIQNTRS